MQRHWKSSAPAAVLGLVLATGCQTVSVFHTARPVEPGRTEFTVAGTAVGDAAGNFDSVAPTIRLRRGLVPRLDLGIDAIFARADVNDAMHPVFAFGGAIDLNLMLVDLGLMKLAVDPLVSGSYSPSDKAFLVEGQLNLLLDLVSTRFFSLTTGLRPGVRMVATGDGVDVHRSPRMVASTFLAAKVTFFGLSLMPEVDLLFAGREGEAPLYTAGLALIF